MKLNPTHRVSHQRFCRIFVLCGFAVFSGFAGDTAPEVHPAWMPALHDVCQQVRERAVAGGLVEENERKAIPTTYAMAHVLVQLTEHAITLQRLLEDMDSVLTEEERLHLAAFVQGMRQQIGLELDFLAQIRERAPSGDKHPFSLIFERAQTLFRSGNLSDVQEQLKAILEQIEKSGNRIQVHAQSTARQYAVFAGQNELAGMHAVLLQQIRPSLFPEHIERAGDENQFSTADLHKRLQIPVFESLQELYFFLRARVYVAYHMFLAIRLEYEEVLNDIQSYGSVNRVLNALHAALVPTPLAGVENEVQFRHTLIEFSANLSDSLLKLVDLRILLSGGSF